MDILKKISVIIFILIIGFGFHLIKKDDEFRINPSLKSGQINNIDGKYYIKINNKYKEITVIHKENLPYRIKKIQKNKNKTIAILTGTFYKPNVFDKLLYGYKRDISYIENILFLSGNELISKNVNEVSDIEWVNNKKLKLIHYNNKEISYIKNPFN
ncbi:MAG: hypothetical protein ACOC2W_03020 [bacterium]